MFNGSGANSSSGGLLVSSFSHCGRGWDSSVLQASSSVLVLDSGSAVYTPFIQSFQWCFELPVAHIKSLLRYKIISVICYWILTILFPNLSYFSNIMTSVSFCKILKNWSLLSSWKPLFFGFHDISLSWLLLYNSLPILILVFWLIFIHQMCIEHVLVCRPCVRRTGTLSRTDQGPCPPGICQCVDKWTLVSW